ncbi:MAG: outer membrane protein assembly factor BamB [Cyclobacteriaceae bacterium]|jgi:outer membrane protein assembly factor BamB
MITETSHVEGVQSYEIIDEDTLCFNYEKSRENLVTYSIKTNTILQEKSSSVAFSSIRRCKGNILISDASRTFQMYNIKESSFSLVEEEIKLGRNISFEGTLSVFKGRIFDRHFGMYDVSSRKTIWIDEDVNSLTQVNGLFLSQIESLILRHDPTTGNVLWRLDFKDVVRSIDTRRPVRILCATKDKIVMGLENNDLIIVIDAATGKVLWELNDTIINGVLLSVDNKFLYKFQVGLVKFDLISGERVGSLIDRDYFDMKDFHSQRDNYVMNEHLIFSTDWRNSNVGCIDSESFKVKWIEKIGTAAYPASKKMGIIGNKLFLHDTNSRLVICSLN